MFRKLKNSKEKSECVFFFSVPGVGYDEDYNLVHSTHGEDFFPKNGVKSEWCLENSPISHK